MFRLSLPSGVAAEIYGGLRGAGAGVLLVFGRLMDMIKGC